MTYQEFEKDLVISMKSITYKLLIFKGIQII